VRIQARQQRRNLRPAIRVAMPSANRRRARTTSDGRSRSEEVARGIEEQRALGDKRTSRGVRLTSFWPSLPAASASR
jgi:hypothetical protein